MILYKYTKIGLHRLFPAILFCGVFLLETAYSQPVNQDKYVQIADAAYHTTQAQFLSTTNDDPIAWQFARACYNLADFATNDDNRAELAIQGISACRKLIREQPKSGPAHYYLGMNLGQLARTELLGALALVQEMETEFTTAWTLDKQVDHAGAARSLGLLYRDAPGWPASIGSKMKSREWLERAGRSSPDFPENLLVLSESYLQWDEPTAAAEKIKALNLLWPQAQTNYTGQAWEKDWADWSARRLAAQKEIIRQSVPTNRTNRRGTD
jgi:hypothetical protein